MEKTPINSHSELLLRIAVLKLDKDIQEDKLKHNFKEFATSLSFLNLFKSKSSTDQSLDFAKQGVIMAIDIIIDKIHGRSRGIKGILGSVFAEKIIYYLLDNKLDAIVSFITTFFKKKTNQEKIQN